MLRTISRRFVTPLAAALLLASCSAQTGPGQFAAEGWEVLFDGRSLDGWEQRGDARWVLEDGYATVVPGTGDGFLTTTRDFADYRIVVDFWADATANGGVYLRVPAMGPGVNPSYEVNIMDSHADWPTGSINSIARYDDANTVGGWSTFDITMQGNRVTVLLNGTKVAEGEAPRPASGRIALQKLGDGVIRYRNVRVMPL